MSMFRTGRDRQTVNIEDEDEFRYWTAQFGVRPDQLEEAIRAAGTRADDIRDYVERHFVVPIRGNTAR